MAAPIDIGTMVTPGYRSQTLGHLGLVAGRFDELGIAKVVDRVIIQDQSQRIVSVGQAVNAMVLSSSALKTCANPCKPWRPSCYAAPGWSNPPPLPG